MGYSKLTYQEYLEHPEFYGTDIPKHADWIAKKGYRGISAIDFYDDIFGEDLEERRMPEDYKTGEYAAIAIERVKKVDKNGNPVLDKKGKQVYTGRRITVTKRNQELYELIDCSDNFCIVAPISYAGRVRTNENARYMYALCIEVDHIEPKNGLSELFYSWERDTMPLPKPTYIVCSGKGLHLYYVFERPIPLWKNIFEGLKEAKNYFTPRLWTKYITTAYQEVEYESVNQPFRCVGSRTKNNGYALAFEIGEKVTIEYLNRFLPEDKQMSCIYKSVCSLEQAKELYPNWYRRRIEKGEKRGHWTRYKPIYYNWKEKILEGAVVGRRYNCLENLCSLAVQCNIPPEEVEKDCREIAESFERLTNSEDNHFTEYDIICALKTYHTASEQAYRRKIEFISKKTGIPLIPNKRNGRKQKDHILLMNTMKQLKKQIGEEVREGRPKGSGTAYERVKEWQQNNPEGRKADCIRDTGLSKPTVLKWWEQARIENLRLYTNKEEMVKLTVEQMEQKAKEIMGHVEKKAAERGISEEEAYEEFRTGKTRQERLQEQADKLIFTESEVTTDLLEKMASAGIRSIQMVPDEEYEAAMFAQYLESLKSE